MLSLKLFYHSVHCTSHFTFLISVCCYLQPHCVKLNKHFFSIHKINQTFFSSERHTIQSQQAYFCFFCFLSFFFNLLGKPIFCLRTTVLNSYLFWYVGFILPQHSMQYTSILSVQRFALKRGIPLTQASAIVFFTHKKKEGMLTSVIQAC